MGKERDRWEAVTLVRLHAVVEGQTEETFMRDVLAPVLGEHSVFADVHRVTTGRRGPRTYRGGLLNYSHLRRDLILWMKEDQQPESWFTTMIDLYGLPPDFPGYEESRSISDPFRRVEFLENKLKLDLDHSRFVPYIQLHEFEALLFSDPKSFSIAFPGETQSITLLADIRKKVATPEHIDDGAQTAPSRRIFDLLPQYAKTSSGPMIAREIGLAKIRKECTHFNAWIEVLLNLIAGLSRST